MKSIRSIVAVALVIAIVAAAYLLIANRQSAPVLTGAGATAISQNGLYRISAVPEPGGVDVGPIHAWTLKVENAEGQAVRSATISVDGGMSAHGHGLPTAPQMTEETSPGVYTIDGVKFSMVGEWQLRFTIDAQAGKDTAVIAFTIE
jgi:hypothetical protein